MQPAHLDGSCACAVDLLPEKPNKVVPQFVRPESADLRNAAQLLASMSNAKSTYKVRQFTDHHLQLIAAPTLSSCGADAL